VIARIVWYNHYPNSCATKDTWH